MSKESIVGFLKKNNDWFTSKELSEALNINNPSADKCLMRIRKYNSDEVEWKIEAGKKNRKIKKYRYKK